MAAGMGLKDPLSRRVFLQLAATAGVAIPMGAADFGFATTAKAGVPGKAAANFAGLQISFWAAFAAGYKSSTNAFGLEDPVDLIHNNDAVREMAQVRGLPTQGVNMLVSTVVSAGETPLVAKLCQENKIYYQCCWEIPDWFTPSDVGDYFIAYETPDSVEAAYQSAKVLFKSIGGEGKVVHIKGLATPTDVARSAGLMKAAAEFPGIQIAGGLRGDWEREKSRQVMLSMVTAHPDMKGVFAQNDDEAIGVLSVIQERKDLSHIKVASVDGIPQAVEEVAKGGNLVATNLALPPFMAGTAATMLFDAFNGWKPSLPERLIYTGSPTATAENAGKIYQDIYKAAELPFDWKKMSKTLSPNDWDPQNKIVPIDPKVHWNGAKGEAKLNAAYNAPDWPDQLAKATKMYADHYKSGPFYAA